MECIHIGLSAPTHDYFAAGELLAASLKRSAGPIDRGGHVQVTRCPGAEAFHHLHDRVWAPLGL